MSNTYDEDPPIKTGPASQAYLDNWDRIFGEKPDDLVEVVEEYHIGKDGDVSEPTFTVSQPPRDPNCTSSECEIRNLCTGSAHCPYIRDANYKVVDPPKDTDAYEMRLKLWGWRCNTCDKIVYDPENHQYHAIIKLDE